mgnify:FL=1
MDLELRRHIEEIVTISDHEFHLISQYFATKKFSKKEFLILQGEKVNYMYFVVSGLLKLTFNDESGKEHILSFAMEDWWETDYLAFNTGSRASMSLQCLESSHILCLTLDNFKNLCATFPKIEHFFLQKAISGHIATQQRILSLLGSNANDRYNQLLSKYPSLIHRIPKTTLAAYLGVSRETLSRLHIR